MPIFGLKPFTVKDFHISYRLVLFIKKNLDLALSKKLLHYQKLKNTQTNYVKDWRRIQAHLQLYTG